MQQIPEWLPSFVDDIEEQFKIHLVFDNENPNYPVHISPESHGLSRNSGYTVLEYLEALTGLPPNMLGKLARSDKLNDKFDVLISEQALKELENYYQFGSSH